MLDGDKRMRGLGQEELVARIDDNANRELVDYRGNEWLPGGMTLAHGSIPCSATIAA